MIERLIPLTASPSESFFLWGPRKTGKTTLLKKLFPDSFWVNLLKTDEVLKYSQAPYRLRQELLAAEPQSPIVIDEVQKVPALLDEVHYLIEEKGYTFALCGSSARKVKRGHANLLGGRAVRYELFGLSAVEIGNEFSLEKMLNHGYLPSHYLRDSSGRIVRSYVNSYLKEEILDEGLVRNLPVFAQFLDAAALCDTEFINYSNIASDCGVSSTTVKDYFTILEDTLLGRLLPAYTKRPKRRVRSAPKFYFADVAVANHLAKRGHIQLGSEAFGKAFENWCFHELSLFREYSELFFDLSYWTLTTGVEVDFVLGDMEVAIEAKARRSITPRHLKGLREIAKDYPKIKKRLMVCCEEIPRETEDGILILPYRDFYERLWAREFIC
ncbi:AAA family ATPase [bacterium]|nr:AAA family ATPase [bacterium]